MSTMDLGVSQAELLEMVVERAAQKIAGDATDYEGKLRTKVEREMEKRIAEAVTRIGDEVIAPAVADGLEKIAIQRTNEWGEAKGRALTIREFLAQRAEAYLTEEVNYDGQTAAEYKRKHGYGSGFNRYSTRAAWLVDRHFQSSIEASMKEAVKNANEVIAEGIAGAVKAKVAELAKSFAVKVEKPR